GSLNPMIGTYEMAMPEGFLLEPHHHESDARRDAMAKYERLSPLDRTFLDLEYPETHMHVAGVTIFDAIPLRTLDGGIDIEKIRRYVASRLHLIPRYRQRIARIPLEDHPVWVDDDRFNLEYHVRHTALPRPGD